MGNALLTALSGKGSSSSSLISALLADAPSSSSKHSSVGGFLDNLAGDVRDSAVGLPTGLVHLVQHPTSSVEAMGKATWHDWSPLFEGHPGEFAHQFYAHPLAPLLDVATVLTGGAGIAGRLARVSLDSGLVRDSSAIGKLGKFSKSGTMKFDSVDSKGNSLPTLVKHTSSNPMAKAQQLAVHKLVNTVSPHLPGWLGETMSTASRYDRLQTKLMSPRAAALQAQIHTFVRAGKDLTGRDSRIYRRNILRHSYGQLKHMAVEWDPAKPLPEGYRYIHGVPAVGKGGRNDFFALKTNSIEDDLGKSPAGFSRRYTTPNAKAAAKNGLGQHLIVPLHTVDKFAQEGVNASKTVKLLYSKPVSVWKAILLGDNPAYFTHNAVGNFFMYAMGHGGTAGFKGFTDALSQVKGQASAIHSMGRASASLNPHWMETNFRDQLNNTFSASQRGGGKFNSALYRYSLFPLTHAVADQFLRRAAINAEMRAAPEVKALMKRGNSFDEAASKALNGVNGAAKEASANLRGRVSQKVMETMGDYHSMNAGERMVASVMPFYTWNRHAFRFTKNAVVEHPGRINAAAKLSNQGSEETKKALGDIPTFLLGSVPGSMIGIGSSPGRKSLLETQSLNPLSTIPDIVDAARTLVGQGKLKPGETIASQLNPVLSNAIQYLTGTNITTGAPVKKLKGGVVGNVLGYTAKNLPQATLLQRIVSGNPQPKVNRQTGKQNPFLFSKNKQAAVSGLLASHIEQMSPEAAQKQYDQEHNIKKGRKSKNSLIAALSG